MNNMNAYDIIIKPVMSEKSLGGIEAKRYTFYVNIHATKTEVKAAVQEIYGVQVEDVNTIKCRGKLKRQGKNSGYTPDFKKAVVQLTAKSKAITAFESLR